MVRSCNFSTPSESGLRKCYYDEWYQSDYVSSALRIAEVDVGISLVSSIRCTLGTSFCGCISAEAESVLSEQVGGKIQVEIEIEIELSLEPVLSQ